MLKLNELYKTNEYVNIKTFIFNGTKIDTKHNNSCT